MDFAKEQLFHQLSLGRELEFHLGSRAYFIGPTSEGKGHSLHCETSQQILFTGTLEELFSYVFPGGYSLKEHFSEFQIDYLL